MATKGNRAQGALSGAAAGAGIGSYAGSWGAGIGAGLGSLLGLFGSGGDKPTSPELQALIDQQLSRQYENNPLVESEMQLAFSRLPSADQAGLTPPSYAGAMGQLGPDLTQGVPGNYNESESVRKILRLMQVRQQMASPIYQAILHMARRRMPTAFQNLGNIGGPGLPDTNPPQPGTPNPNDPNDPSNQG